MRNPWIQWCVLLPREVDHPAFEDMKDVAYRSLRALGMGTGLCHMEWFRRKDGSVAVSEVGARPPGAQIMSLMSFAHDVDMHAAWARLVVHDRFDPPVRRWAVGAAYLRAQGEGRAIVAVHGLDRLSAATQDAIVDVLVAFGWRESRPNPLSVRDETPTVLQPLALANGVMASRIVRLSDDHAVTALCLMVVVFWQAHRLQWPKDRRPTAAQFATAG